jgi:hypothetical protein
MHQLILLKTADGKGLDFDNPHFQFYLNKIKTNKVLLTMDGVFPEMTPAQRGYYFAGIVSKFAEEKGMSQDAVHEYLKLTCNPIPYVNPKTGLITMVGGSIQAFNKYQMAEYIDKCIMEMAMQDFIVLTPDEYFESISPQRKTG